MSINLVYRASESGNKCTEASFHAPVHVAPREDPNAPSHLVHLLVDTGSPFTWLVSDRCTRTIDGKISDCQGSALPVSEFPQFQTSSRLTVTFGHGRMVGVSSPLRFRFDPEKEAAEGSDSLALHALVATEQHGSVFMKIGNFDGILGLARTASAAAAASAAVDRKKYSFLHSLCNSHRNFQEIFSIKFAKDSGSLHFGLTADKPEDFRRFSLVGNDFWILQATDVKPTASSQVIHKPESFGQSFGKTKVVLDSGTVETALPPALLAKLGKDAKNFRLLMKDDDGVDVEIAVSTECAFMELDLSGTMFEGAVVLGQSFFVGREVRFGPTWVDIRG